jgi:methionyl-tRNA formyltransferase
MTIHRMTGEMDAGGVAHAERVTLGPDDTYALHMQRLGAVLPRVVIEFVQQLALRGDALPLREQDAAAVGYWPRPSDADRTIDWSWTGARIDALVRACNPAYGGALTLLGGVPLRLLEISPALPCANRQVLPGTIVSASAEEGVRVACGQDETLFLNIVCSNDGFFSGRRLARVFGLGSGTRLT